MRAFTLTELLVVIGIMVLLIAILLPALSSARRKAKAAATSATIGAISTALNAYEQDFLDYPPAYTADGDWTTVTGQTGDVGVPGFEAVGIWLVGPGRADFPAAPQVDPAKQYNTGDCVTNTTNDYFAIADNASGGALTDKSKWLPLSYQYTPPVGPQVTLSHFADGLDGPGMKVGNKQYGPYLQPEHVRMRGGAILDSWDHPIAYFPVHAKNVSIRAQSNGKRGYCDTSIWSKYDALDNLPLFLWPNELLSNATDQKKAVQRVRVMLGDTGTDTTPGTPNGIIDGNESPIEDHPYLLWSAGPDGHFSVKDPTTDAAREVGRCDDVANFK